MTERVARYAGGSEPRGNKLRESVDNNGVHCSWLWWCPGCDEPHQCDARWTFDGNEERPTFSPSVLVTCEWGIKREPRRCHSFVQGGRVQYLSDCTHKLAGQTIDLPDWPWR